MERLALDRHELHPLEIVKVQTDGSGARLWVRNHSAKSVEFTVGSKSLKAEPGKTVSATVNARGAAPFEALPLVVRSRALPDIRHTIFLHHPKAETEWVVRESEGLTLRVARDGSGALLVRDGKVVAILAPLVHREGVLPALELRESGGALRFQGEGTTLVIAADRGEVAVSIESDRPAEGPVLRAMGALEQGLFAGLEYLGKGERSSSTLDIETDEHLRFAPDRLKVTMPLMACRTDAVTAAMTWKDMALQPVFASPNLLDGTTDHRMSLRGRKIEATLLVRDPAPLEEAILWALRKHELPPLPEAPRSRKAQERLSLQAIHGPLRGPDGWGHCAEPNWKRAPHADFLSTIWRLTGRAPEMPRIVPGGSHVRNDAIYFLTGRAREYLDQKRNQVKHILARQRPDGSFRYRGKYRRGHFEDTASGYCAQPAAVLLDYAYVTGDREALAAAAKTLEYMKRFRTPRGAQTWELALHTPDVLASAYLVWAYARGYALTGKADYLQRARAWALSGVPFVYLWGEYPTMAYATIPVYGATNWREPNWMGLPVQWCGLVYAYALTLLAPHDETVDWKALAKGILLAGERMQYPEGPLAGCLPDVFSLRQQQRGGPSINPCALVSLRLALAGEADSLAVAAEGKHRVAAPFPVTIHAGKAHIRSKPGLKYQVLIDGSRIVDVASKGEDVLPLE